ncbi:putative reverse transcriptase domain-containing protein [Tanacetum coccineum]
MFEAVASQDVWIRMHFLGYQVPIMTLMFYIVRICLTTFLTMSLPSARLRYAFIEFPSKEACRKALELNGAFVHQTMKITVELGDPGRRAAGGGGSKSGRRARGHCDVCALDTLLEEVLKRVWISIKKEAHVNFLTDPLDARPTLTPADAALKAASCKVTKHEKACIKNQHVFVPFAFDTFGFLAPEALELLNRVQRQNALGTKKRTAPHFVGHPLVRENVIRWYEKMWCRWYTYTPLNHKKTKKKQRRENGTTTRAVSRSVLLPFSTALAVMYGARENGSTTGVVSRSIFSCRSLAPENGTTVPYTSKKFAFKGSPARDRPIWMPGVARYEV